jgi:DNA-binding CsgD family transcriptional regulator
MVTELSGQILTAIHRAPQDKGFWKLMVTLLRRQCDVSFANFLIRRPNDQQHGFEYFEGGSLSAGVRTTYRESYEAIDPIPYFDMKPGTVLDLEDIYGGSAYDQDEFFRDFLAPSGIARMLIVRCCEPGGFSAWLTLGRRQDEAPFETRVRELLTKLAGHVAIALENWAAAEKARLERDVYAGVAATIQVFPLVLDDRGRLLDVDICQNARVSQFEGLQVDRAGRLRAMDAWRDDELQGHLKRLCQDERAENVSMRLSDNPPTDLLLARLPSPTRLFRTRVPHITVLVRRGAAVIDENSIAMLFKLSRREAALAAKLAGGVRLAEASRQLGLTTETGRTYAKRVLSKTGVTSQSDLVRSILTSSASLAGVFRS